MRKYLVCALLTVALCCLPLAAQSGAAPAKPAAPAAEKAQPTTEKAPATKTKTAAPRKINIDYSSAKTLQTLSGIDAATAQKIRAGRPYKTTDELVTKNVLTQDQYDKIKDKIYAKPVKPKPKAGAKAKPEATAPAPATTEKPKQQ